MLLYDFLVKFAVEFDRDFNKIFHDFDIIVITYKFVFNVIFKFFTIYNYLNFVVSLNKIDFFFNLTI